MFHTVFLNVSNDYILSSTIKDIVYPYRPDVLHYVNICLLTLSNLAGNSHYRAVLYGETFVWRKVKKSMIATLWTHLYVLPSSSI